MKRTTRRNSKPISNNRPNKTEKQHYNVMPSKQMCNNKTHSVVIWNYKGNKKLIPKCPICKPYNHYSKRNQYANKVIDTISTYNGLSTYNLSNNQLNILGKLRGVKL